MGDMQQGVFISYGHDEYALFAQRLRDDLLKEGFRVWMDDQEIRHGHDWEISIEEGLKSSSWVVACLTPHAMRRPDGVCLDELATARFKGLSIAPVMVQAVEPPLSICRIQWLDVRKSLTPSEDAYSINEETYQQHYNLLLSTLLGENKLDFEGAQASLREVLRPFDYGVEIDRHVPGFYGRQWLFDEFDTWLNGKSAQQGNSRVLWIQGAVGVGKTALAAMLAHKQPEVMGMHFCKASDSDRSNPVRVLCSLAYQLATQVPAYRDSLLSNPELKGIHEKSCEAVFRTLFVDPIREVPKPDGIRVLVIDALDEALLNGKNSLAEVLGGNMVDQLPSWLRLVVTSRPDPELARRLSCLVPTVLNAEDKKNEKDLIGYAMREVQKRLLDTQENEHSSIVRALVEKCEGCFLYLHMVFEEVDKSRLDLLFPHNFPLGLNGIYTSFFERQFKDVEAYQEHQRPLLELLVSTSKPLPVDVAEFILDWDDYDADDALEPLGALFPVNKDIDGSSIIEPFHKSIIDWLLNREQCGRNFRVSKKKGAERFCEKLWPEFEKFKGAETLSINESDLFQMLTHVTKILGYHNKVCELVSHPECLIHHEGKLGLYANDTESINRMIDSYIQVISSTRDVDKRIKLSLVVLKYLSPLRNYFDDVHDVSLVRLYRELLFDLPVLIDELFHKEGKIPTKVMSDCLWAAHILSWVYSEHHSEIFYRKLLAINREMYKEDNLHTAQALRGLAKALGNDNAESEGLYRQALAIRCDLLDEKHSDVLESISDLTSFLENE